jgi:hypothetical protein
MSAPQRFQGRFEFSEAAAIANAKERIRRSAIEIPEAFVFGDDDVTLDLEGDFPAGFFQDMRYLVMLVAEQAARGAVTCSYGERGRREVTRVEARGGGARPLPPESVPPPPPTDALGLVREAVTERRSPKGLGLSPLEIAQCLWQLVRESKDAAGILGEMLLCGPGEAWESTFWPIEAADFSLDDLAKLLRAHASDVAEEDALHRAWPPSLDALFAARSGHREALRAMTESLRGPVRLFATWSLARLGGASGVDDALLPILLKQWESTERYPGWERVYPRAAWDRAVVDHVLATKACHGRHDLERHFEHASDDERVRMLCLVHQNDVDEIARAIDALDSRETIVREAIDLSQTPTPEKAHFTRCFHVGLALLRAGDTDPRWDPIHAAVFRKVELLTAQALNEDPRANPARTAWYSAMRALPEERRARIYLAGTAFGWVYFDRDPVPLLVRSVVRTIAGLPADPAPAEVPDHAGAYLGGLGPTVVAEIAAALPATKGAKRRTALAEALARIDTRESTALLEELSRDRAKGTSEVARAALRTRA